jgi:Putative DNA-binding domain
LGKYIRTAAGFANARGGYIVYGIGRSPHTLLGMKGDAFEKLDPEKLTHYLNEHFDPLIDWEHHIHELDGKVFGLIYIYESQNKPVICKKNEDEAKSLKEGEIYYRYRGRTQTIRYAELKELIDERRKREQLLWFKHLKDIARIGIADAALLDLRTGMVKGAGANLVIDESLIPQLAFIRDGEFNETKGKPTLKLIGSIETAGSTAKSFQGKVHVVKTQGIRATDVIRAFLMAENVSEPMSYLTQIAWESSAFLPCYYYLHLSGLGATQAIGLIEREHSTSRAKVKLIERLKSDEALCVTIPSANNKSGDRKLEIRKNLLARKLRDGANDKELGDILDMVRTLKKSDLPLSYIRELLLNIFNKNFAKQEQGLNDKIRRAICYIDWLHYGERVKP